MKNTIKRVIAADNYVRGFFAYTTEMAKKAAKKHGLSIVPAAALGRLLTAASMMGIMMKNKNDKCSIIVEGDGPMKGLCVTSDVNGMVKGYVYNNDFEQYAKADGHLDIGGAIGNGKLTVIKDTGSREPYNSTVPLVTGELGEDLTYYFATSEQTPTSVGLGVLFDKNTANIIQAGGFIVQVMPNTPDEVIDKLSKNIENIKSVTEYLSEGNSCDKLMEAVLDGFDYKVTDETEVGFYCNCSKNYIVNQLKGLPKNQLIEIFKDTNTIEINCHMCSSKYKINKEDIL